MAKKNLRICTLKDNSGTMLIGYGILRKSELGGEEMVFTREGTNRIDGSNRAKEECEAELLRRQPHRAGTDLMSYAG